jgi:hypothetical protein
MKRQAQARDQKDLASGAATPEDMMLLKKEQIRSAKVKWPDGSLSDDK